ncbi:unnamed protein product [Bursaphelenchus xylophilus]|uniref:(pine wood nematode) hypothetical protein n=1 Tax=Bursaphelenchus xylophilus TaxID=6326 RepID=A0A811KR01_BURXY|nr:unnamed protein product [Bursaphelenchus xylophilus]CAG9101990.1 unnamed protein product [Bursaphelenchus xylophilus]
MVYGISYEKTSGEKNFVNLGPARFANERTERQRISVPSIGDDPRTETNSQPCLSNPGDQELDLLPSDERLSKNHWCFVCGMCTTDDE